MRSILPVVSLLIGACTTKTIYEVPPIESPCSLGSGESVCRAEIDCTDPGVCCEQDTAGGCLSVCLACCDFPHGTDVEGIQALRCQPIVFADSDGGAP